MSVEPLQHKHNENCPWGGNDSWLHYLVTAAPDFLWFDVQDVGDYQGSVYGIALYQGKIAVYEDSYGSCSGCGAWGEGGEPTNQEQVIKRSHLFGSTDEATAYLFSGEFSRYDTPNTGRMVRAIKAADAFDAHWNQVVPT